MENGPSFKNPACRSRLAVIFALGSMLLMLEAENISAQTAVAGNSGPICAGEPVMLYETGSDAVSWEWSSSGTAVFNDRTLQNPTATGVTDGEVFTVIITYDDDDDDNDDGTATATTVVTVFNGVPERPGQITGDEEQCVNATGVVYSISPVAKTTDYRWEVPTGVEITSGQGTVSITVTIGPSAPATGTIRVYAVNACGEGLPRSKNLYVTQLPAAASSITGSSYFTPGATGVPYSIDPVTNATSYVWSFTGAGVTINGNGSNSVTLDFASDATAGHLSVRGQNDCGDGTASYLDLMSAAKTTYTLIRFSGGALLRRRNHETGME